MRQRNFARRRVDVAAEQTGVARGVVRRAKRPPRHQRLARGQQSDDAVNLRRFERLVQGQGRQNRRQPFGQHGFAGAGRTNEQRVVSAGGGDFQCAFHVFLSFDLGKVQVVVVRLIEDFGNVHLRRRNFYFTFEKARGFTQILNGDDLQPFHDGSFGGVFRRNKHADPAVGARAQGDGQNALARTHRAGEREFPHDDKIVELVGFDLFPGGEHAQRDGQVEARPFLFHVGGREVDGRAPHRKFETGIGERGRNAVARFLHRGIRQADNDNYWVEITYFMQYPIRHMKAYSYIRFSRPEQIQGDSLRRQLESTREYCSKNGLALDESLSFRDLGVSAYTGDNIHRGRLGAFLRAIDEGKVQKGSCLIVENLDRLSRGQIDDATELFKRILRKGIDIVTLTDGKRFTKDSLNNPADLMLSILYFHRAYDESVQKGKRIRAAWNNKRKNAAAEPLTAVCPSWLRLNRDKGKFEEIRERVKTVRHIFELSKSGMGNGSIAKLLNADGEPGIGRVNSWHASVVARILTNRAVLGEFQPCKYVTRNKREPEGEPIKGYYPRIISDELFSTVQYRQKQRRVAGSGRRGNMLHNLFSHIAKCGFCGGTMVSVSKDPRYHELVCDGARRGLKCRYVSYPYHEFETSFLTFVKELDLKAVMQPSGNGSQTAEAIEQLRASIAEREMKLNNLGEAVALAKKPLPMLVSMMEKITTEKTAEEKSLGELIAKEAEESKPIQKLEDLKTLIATAQKTTGPKANEMRLALREAIRGCIEKILVWPYDIIKPPPPGSIGWKERRELTKTGWSLTSEVQRRERMYHVYFKNDPNHRVVMSHPKYGGPPSMKAVPVKFKGKLGKQFSGIYMPDYHKGKTKGI